MCAFYLHDNENILASEDWLDRKTLIQRYKISRGNKSLIFISLIEIHLDAAYASRAKNDDEREFWIDYRN